MGLAALIDTRAGTAVAVCLGGEETCVEALGAYGVVELARAQIEAMLPTFVLSRLTRFATFTAFHHSLLGLQTASKTLKLVKALQTGTTLGARAKPFGSAFRPM